MYLKKMFAIAMIVLCHYTVLAQDTVTVEGTITGQEDGIPIPGVNVFILGTKSGTTTDFDGYYQLKVEKDAVLSFSFTGKKTVTTDVAGRTTINVQLEEEASELEQVVVIGYGTTRRSSLTGSVAKLENKNLDELPYTDVSSGIKGKIAGVQIRNTSTELGADPEIVIRGTGSISLSSAPLVVVDGFPFDDGLQFINPSTIKSIEVLKDASSTAIYGSRGANGVILVTTKDGKEGKAKFEFKTYTGFKRAFREVDILDAVEYSDLDLERNRVVGIDDYSAIQVAKREIAINSGGPTNWQAEALRDPAVIQSYLLNVSGGGKDNKYFISGQYVTNEGLLKDNFLDRLSLSVKFKSKLSDRVSLNLSVIPSYTENRRSGINFTDVLRYETWIPVRHNAYTSALTGREIGSYAHNPHFDFPTGQNFEYINASGEPDLATVTGTLWGSNNFNPIAAQIETEDIQHDYRLVTNGSITWEILNNLKLRSSANALLHQRTRETFEGRLGNRSNTNLGAANDRLRTKYVFENTLTYNKSFNKSELAVLLGTTYERDLFKFTNIEATGFAVENVTTLNNAGSLVLEDTNTLKYENILSSYLGRINYAYDDRYLFSVAARADGYSKFGENNQYGLFPSVSIGWNIGNEKFWQDNISFINRFKLRTSYGISGSNSINVEDFPARNLLFQSNYPLGNSTVGQSSNTGYGQINSFIGNPNISWETVEEYDTGIELGFLNNSISLTGDYYYKISQDLILEEQIPLVTGYDTYFNNTGKVQNSGFEFELSTNVGNGKFNWQASANISFNENKLISLGGQEQTISTGERTDQYLSRVGDPYIQFFGYQTDGIWQTQAEIDSNVSFANDVPGALRIVDVNGDGVLDADDRTVIGNPFPDFNWGFTNNFTYGNFDLNIALQGSQGAEVRYGDAFYIEVQRYHKNYAVGAWYDESVIATEPQERTGTPWLETDRGIQDASYISLREVILGYTIPADAMKSTGLDKARIYISAQNPIYIVSDDYYGLNPEGISTPTAISGNPFITGYQRGVAPIEQQLLIGLDINF
ncbi:TonB-dependent receptor [Aquimarina addita]|uniref:TonB-dependent receptor n=1 Tax=Aquimarina addita TaxID=870485 RepID=A0ABP6UPG7_9FLAO